MGDNKETCTCGNCGGCGGYMQNDYQGDVAWDVCAVCNGSGEEPK